MKKVSVIKIGGNVLDDAISLEQFLKRFSLMDGFKILVHGGGKAATALANKLGVEQQMVDGRRLTDSETLKIVTMVYAGEINKNIVAQLQAEGCNAFGLSGVDGNLILSKKRESTEIDFGFAGDVEAINKDLLSTLIETGFVPVIAPITHDGKGQLLNTNADTIANKIALALSSIYEVHLYFLFEKKGVLMDAENESSSIPQLSKELYSELKERKKVFAGMLPKLDNAFEAIDKGVSKVIIGRAEDLNELLKSNAGTIIS